MALGQVVGLMVEDTEDIAGLDVSQYIGEQGTGAAAAPVKAAPTQDV